MNILHIAAHLGGGVGKAHAALAETAAAGRGRVRRTRHTYALLEAPRDTAYAERIAMAGGRIVVTPGPGQLAELIETADIVQVEWWNHPRLYALLATLPLPAMRLALWVHISGLAPPLLPTGLVALADQTLFTSACSLAAPNLQPLIAERPEAFEVANSGYGFPAPDRNACPTGQLKYGYLGTLDFIKMHPGVFDVIDAVESDIRVSFFGHLDPTGEVAARAAAMKHPGRVRFEGYAADPQAVLGKLDVFLYLLAPGHYGTAENALVEAMSVGAAPIVWNNPAETGIVRDGRNGLVVDDLATCAALIDWTRRNPRRVAKLGAKGMYDMAQTRTPAVALRTFARTYAALAGQPRRNRDFAAALGRDSRTWFLSTLRAEDGARAQDTRTGDCRLFSDMASKGSLGHFRTCFPDDASLSGFS